MLNKAELHNPHLEGEAFFWEGGDTGILLMHGLTATPAEVYPLARKLHAQGYAISGPLLPGHGASPADLNRVHWREWIEEGARAYKRLAAKCSRVLVGGESTGGVVALYLAAKFPEIAAVLCYAPAIKLNLSLLGVIKLYLSAPFIASLPKPDLESSDAWQGYKVNPLKGIIQLLRLQRGTRACLSDIQQPVLIVQGRLDTVIAPESGEIILQGVNSTLKELHWMERSPHVIIVEQELDEVAELSVKFIKAIPNLDHPKIR